MFLYYRTLITLFACLWHRNPLFLILVPGTRVILEVLQTLSQRPELQ